MNRKLTMLYAFTLIFACSPAFAGDTTDKGSGHSQMKMGKIDNTSTGTVRKVKTAKATARKVTKEEVGKEAVCPVTGDTFKVNAKTLSASYKGEIYYFCCPGCKKPFLENPEKYLQKKQEPQAKTYICPMGDYQGDKPGKCPKCGMDLVEKKPDSKAQIFACPMGCAESDKPGKCPKCGMDLVEKK